MTKVRAAVLACLTVGAIAAIAASPNGAAVESGSHPLAAAQPTPPPPVAEPNVFEGSVTIDQQPAPDGTLVEAVVDGVVCDTNVTAAGHYRLTVEVFQCGGPMDTVTFRVGGRIANETADLVSPLATLTLNLTVGPRAISPAQLYGISTGCSGEFPGRAKVTFMWDAGFGQSQWLDLSLANNGFRPGTFLAAGPLPVVYARAAGNELARFTWDGLIPNTRHFWRVNTADSGMWRPSDTTSFVTPDCHSERPGAATRMGVSQQWCGPEPARARVTFDWEPALFFGRTASGLEYTAPGEQWLDISLFDNGFALGTFVGIRVPDEASFGPFDVRGIRGGAAHYWRINTLGPDGWRPSATQYFDAIQCPG